MSPQPTALQFWRQRHGRRWLGLDFTPLHDVPFHARITPYLAELRSLRLELSAGLSFRDKVLVRDGDDAFGFLIAATPALEVSHRAKEFCLRRGQATLLHVSETGAVGATRTFRLESVLVPAASLRERVRHPEDLVSQRFRPGEATVLLRGYLRALERRPVRTEDARAMVATHLVDLVALALRPDGALGDTRLEAVSEARVRRTLDLIGKSYADPDLDIGAAAARLGISTRYLQRLLRESGTTFRATLREVRLQHALRLLREGEITRITDIAMTTGFADASSFNRLFRARFGDSPKALRRAAVTTSPTRDRMGRGNHSIGFERGA
jgi:AraC-like DNA-binding protein